MNKEFMLLSDGDLAITDENGHISKRVYDNNSQEILLLENKIEIVDKKLEKLNHTLREQNSNISFFKKMIKIQPIIIVLLMLGGSVVAGLLSPGEFLTKGIYNSLLALVSGTCMGGTAAIYFGLLNHTYKKEVKKTNDELVKAKQIKEDYEKELLAVKDKQIDPLNKTITMNNPISLLDQTNVIESQIDDELNKAHEDYLSKEPKKLVLRRKK